MYRLQMLLSLFFHAFNLEIQCCWLRWFRIGDFVHLKIKFVRVLCRHYLKVISNALLLQAACGGLKQAELQGGAGVLGDSPLACVLYLLFLLTVFTESLYISRHSRSPLLCSNFSSFYGKISFHYINLEFTWFSFSSSLVPPLLLPQLHFPDFFLRLLPPSFQAF